VSLLYGDKFCVVSLRSEKVILLSHIHNVAAFNNLEPRVSGTVDLERGKQENELGWEVQLQDSKNTHQRDADLDAQDEHRSFP
jgi:hypothetical protein